MRGTDEDRREAYRWAARHLARQKRPSKLGVKAEVELIIAALQNAAGGAKCTA